VIIGTKFRETPESSVDDQLTPVQFDRAMPKHAISLWTFILTATTAAENGLGGSKIGFYEQALDNELIMQMTPSETRALFEYIYSRMGGAVPATDALIWDWPFYLLAMLAPMLDGGKYPEVGLPGNSDKVWRTGADGAADGLSVGTFLIGWKKSMREPTHSPLMVGRVLSGMTLSTKGNLYEINWQPVPCVGFVINGFAHFDRFKLYAADDKGEVREVADVTHDQVLALLDPYNVQSITDPVFIPLDQPYILNKGSYILFDTGAGYTGTERIVPIQLVPAPNAVKG
jgi:hypothetical protein